MKANRLGRSAIVVSDICMGTMTFGTGADEKISHEILDRSFDAGIDFFDTAESYPVPPDKEYVGLSEEIVGRWLKTKSRDSVIIATKVAGPSHGWIKAVVRDGKTCLDRHHIIRAVEGSLKRLQTDYIDLYQTHWPDHDTPYEEILAALDELVRSGKVRILGSSNETSWGVTKASMVAEMNGLARYETVQNNFSMNNRRFEDELAQACRQEQVSLIPYSPLAGGVLSGKYNDGKLPEGARFTKYLSVGERQAAMVKRFVNPRTLDSTAQFMAIAEAAEISPVTLATAWSKQHDFVASTIVGATKVEQLDDIFAAADLVLSDETMKAVDRVTRKIRYPMG